MIEFINNEDLKNMIILSENIKITKVLPVLDTKRLDENVVYFYVLAKNNIKALENYLTYVTVVTSNGDLENPLDLILTIEGIGMIPYIFSSEEKHLLMKEIREFLLLKAVPNTKNVKIQNIYGVLEARKIPNSHGITEFLVGVKLNKEHLNKRGTYVKVWIDENNIGSLMSIKLILANIGVVDYEFTPAQERRIFEEINEYIFEKAFSYN